MTKILIKNGNIVTMDATRRIFRGHILIENDRLKKIFYDSTDLVQYESIADRIIDATGKTIIPGFVQTHIHLTQTIFRGFADDLELMDWLKKRIWPLEASHDANSNHYSAKLGLAELIKGGTTSIVDMETVNHTEVAFEAIYESGIRAMSGKCMMDHSPDVPKGLMEDTKSSIKESLRLLKTWHNKDNGRIKYAFNPRFVVSCSQELLQKVGDLAKEYGVFIHTHASQNSLEIDMVEKERGMRNITYLHKLGLTGENLILAHCIWLDDEEVRILKNTGTKVSHCPSCNMKVASGIAKIPELLAEGINVSLGADGSPANNNLSMFTEMRTASLLQKVRLLNPTALSAKTVFEMATLGGAMAMGLSHEIGSLEEGKKADLVILDLNKIHTIPAALIDTISAIVYSATPDNVESVMVSGKFLMENKKMLTLNEKDIIDNCLRIAEKKLSLL